MYCVHKPGYDLATMRAVVVAYRRVRQAGGLAPRAREAAIAALPKDRRYVTPPFAPDWNARTL